MGTTENKERGMLTAEVFINGERFGQAEFATTQALADAVRAWQAKEGYWIRLGFEAQVALIQEGHYAQTWDEYRAEALAEANAEQDEAGELWEIGTSDLNHMVVGRVFGARLVAA